MFRVWGLGFRVQDLVLRVSGFGVLFSESLDPFEV